MGTLDIFAFTNLVRYLNVKSSKLHIKEAFEMVAYEEKGRITIDNFRRIVQEPHFLTRQQLCSFTSL